MYLPKLLHYMPLLVQIKTAMSHLELLKMITTIQSKDAYVLNGIDNSIHAHLQMIKLLKSKGKFMQFINISIINLAKQVDY